MPPGILKLCYCFMMYFYTTINVPISLMNFSIWPFFFSLMFWSLLEFYSKNLNILSKNSCSPYEVGFVLNLWILLASLQPYRFLAWTRHSYWASDTWKKPFCLLLKKHTCCYVIQCVSRLKLLFECGLWLILVLKGLNKLWHS